MKKFLASVVLDRRGDAPYRERRLRGQVRERDGEEEIRVGHAAVRPELPKNWTEQRHEHVSTRDEKSGRHRSGELTAEERQERDVSRRVAERRVGMKHPREQDDEKDAEQRSAFDEAYENEDGQERSEGVKDKEKEDAEIVEHLGEEIPVDAEVGGEVLGREEETVRGVEPLARRRQMPESGGGERHKKNAPRDGPRRQVRCRLSDGKTATTVASHPSCSCSSSTRSESLFA